ncbi:MAG: nucleoside hydrolase [Anaerolineaceae bacterium]|nr:nucleoside hydrolase [Anaerolineaceae bacterium]
MNEDTISQPNLHIIWDADGSPDSVIALLYFLQNPTISVDAITVSCGQAHPDIFAVKLVRMLARLGRKDIPVAAGRAIPFMGNNAFPDPWRKLTDEFWGIDLPEADEPVHTLPASDLIIDVLNKSSNPVTLFVSGTHTNLAEVLRLGSYIIDKIASVHVMGGALYVPGNIKSDWPEFHNTVSEWNIWVDPIAASEVFNAGLDMHLTPLDATNQVTWTSHDADTWDAFGTPEGILAAEILRFFLEYSNPDGVYLWDLLAAANTTNPDLCQHEWVHIRVVTDSGDEEGRTVVVSDQPENTSAFLIPQEDEIKQLVAQTLGMS